MKVRFYLSIGLAGCNQEEVVEIDQTEWDECKFDQEREELLDQYWRDWSNNYLDGGYELVGEA